MDHTSPQTDCHPICEPSRFRPAQSIPLEMASSSIKVNRVRRAKPRRLT